MKDALGDRMKQNYENRNQTYLLRRVPVIIRVDGNAFHTLTRSMFEKPFDLHLMSWMLKAACEVADSLQGFKLGYVQSDEASFLVTDFDDLKTQAWFDYCAQKIASISASRMTGYFNSVAMSSPIGQQKMNGRIAFFDGRCYNVPREEVANYFLWRAKDWERNSLSMFARGHYSQKQLHKKSKGDMHEMLHKKGVNWARLPSECKNGTFIYRSQLDPDHPLTRRVIIKNGDVKPRYDEIESLLEYCLHPKEETEENEDEERDIMRENDESCMKSMGR